MALKPTAMFSIPSFAQCVLYFLYSMSLVLLPYLGRAQLSESFETGLPASYNTTLTSYALNSGSWLAKDVQSGTLGTQSGSKSAQFRSATGSQLISPLLSNGVSTLSFYITASTASGAYQVNVSSDGGQSWVPAPGSPFTIGTTKTWRQINVNSNAINRVQIYRTGAVLYIDDIQINSMPSLSVLQWPSEQTTTYGTASTPDSLLLSVHHSVSSVTITPPNGFLISLQPDFSGNVGTPQQALISGPLTAGTIFKTYLKLANTSTAGVYTGTCVFSTSNQTLMVPLDTSIVYPKPITLQGVQIANKPYDALLQATIIGDPQCVGILPADTPNVTFIGVPQAVFLTPDVGVAKPVSLTGLSLSGSAASNYVVPSSFNLSGTIYPASQTILGVVNPYFVYLGDAPFNVNLYSNHGLPLTYTSSNNAIASVSANGFITINDTGTVEIVVQQTGTSNIAPAPDTHLVLHVIRPNCAHQNGTITYTMMQDSVASSQATVSNLLYCTPGAWLSGEGTNMLWSSQLSNSNSSLGYANASGGFHAALAARGGNFSLDSSRCFTWSVQCRMGQLATLQSFTFASRQALNGPLMYCLRTSIDSFQTNWLTGSLNNNGAWLLYEHNNLLKSVLPNTGEVVFKLFAYGGNGNNDTSLVNWFVDDVAMQWTFRNQPDSAVVGPDQVRCGVLCSDSLGGNTPLVGRGHWMKVSGPGMVVFANQQDGNTTATVNEPGVYTLRWSIDGDSCNGVSYADIQVHYTPPFVWDSLAISQGVCYADSVQVQASLLGGVGTTSIWLNGQTPVLNTFSVIPGVYTLQATDGLGCSTQTSLSISAVTPLQVTTQILHPSCVGAYGVLTILAQGGNGGYTYQVNGIPVTPSSNLVAGTYTVLVSDVLGCTFQTVVTINQPISITIQTYVQSPTCLGCLGALTITPSGGMPPYLIFVNGQASGNVSSLASGTYTVIVEDANACTKSVVVNIPGLLGNINYPPIKITKYVYGHAAIVTWEGNQDSVYRFEYKVQGAGVWNARYVYGTLDTLYPLNTETVYDFRIKAIDTGGVNSAWHTDTFKTTAGCNLPVFNEPLIHAQSAQLSWTCNGGASYRLEYKSIDSLMWRPIDTELTHRTITSLKQGHTYIVRIRSHCALNDWSNWVYDTLSTQVCLPLVFLPPQAQGNSMRIHWNSVPTAASYRLEYRAANQAIWHVAHVIDTVRNITGLLPSTTYQIRVRYKKINNDTSLWAYQTVVTGSGCLQPQFQSPVVNGNAMCLYWSAVADSAYRFEYRRLIDQNWFAFLQSTPSKCIVGLTPNTAYVCRVRAHCKNFDVSDWVYDTLYTTAGCSLPVLNSPTLIGTQVYVHWSHPTATQFRLEYKPIEALLWSSLKLRLPYRTLQNCLPGTQYIYRVRSECSNGDISAWEYDTFYVPTLRPLMDTNSGLSSIDTGMESWQIFPNPFRDELTIQGKGLQPSTMNLECYDASGRLMYSSSLSENRQLDSWSIPTQNWPPGIYYIHLKQNNQAPYRRKVIKY